MIGVLTLKLLIRSQQNSRAKLRPYNRGFFKLAYNYGCTTTIKTAESETFHMYQKKVKTMQMQEPDHWQQSRSEWQANPEYNEYQTGYASTNEPRQQEKISPQTQQSSHKALWITTVILSSLGFFFTLAGIIASSLVLEYANERTVLLASGVIGLVSSILAMLVCIFIFVIAVAALAGRIKRRYYSRVQI